MSLSEMAAATDALLFLLALCAPAVVGLVLWEAGAAFRAWRRSRRRLPAPSPACQRGTAGTDYYRVSKTPRTL